MSEHPERIGRYKIISVLGQGGMGIVYQAQRALGEMVALKTILKKMLAGEVSVANQLTARFNREIKVGLQVQAAGYHKNIVRMFDYNSCEEATDTTPAFIAMEFVEGKSLKEILTAVDTKNQERLTAEEIVRIVSELLEALSFIHQRGIIHRDISASNIMLNHSEGTVKLTDFGIARFKPKNEKVVPEDESDSGKGTEEELTKFIARQIEVPLQMGRKRYMSPEQREMPWLADERSDIYSTGKLFEELLKTNQPSLKAFEAVVNKALAERAVERFQTAEEFKRELLKVNRQRPLLKKMRWVGVVSACLLVGGGLGWCVVNDCFKGRPPPMGYGFLNINTSPSDFEIYINGEKQSQKTPVANLRVPAGMVNIRVVKGSLEKNAVIELSPGKLEMIGNDHLH
ncbi:MAG: hypothetical protein BWK78_00985 [Thiotrichaceae bacterium IS1]|nr:MAG: hypothetical protein BWK78_00985 [Thiotrichaceae bacterium IS1]